MRNKLLMKDHDFLNFSGMNFDITPKQNKFLSKIDRICKSLRSIEEYSYIQETSNDRLVKEFSKIGMLGCPISRKYDGLGYDILTYLLALKRIGEEGSSMRTFFSAHTSIGQMVLQNWANEEQKNDFLKYTTQGQKIMAFGLTEPNAGSDPASLTTTFEKKGNFYVLKGKKKWIGNGTFANLMTTYAREKGSDGKISAFIVDVDSTSNIVRKEIKNKIGLLTVKNAEIEFKNCKIPCTNLLGLKDNGLNIAMSALIDGRLSVAAGAIGVMEDCLKESTIYARLRKQHGSSIAKKQLIQQHISKIIVGIESSKWLVYKAANLRQKLHDYVENLKINDKNWLQKLVKGNMHYKNLRREVDRFAAIAKFYTTNACFETANRSVQIFGSSGYTKKSRVAKHFLDSRATTIYEGTNEILELKIASEFLGKRFRSF
ncbi:MAG: acyl-CoA dehydrogenase family protein [Nitrososphaeraceae archaeon]